jgi:hypothetical protein
MSTDGLPPKTVRRALLLTCVDSRSDREEWGRFPRCPDCGVEAHELTFRPVVRQVDGHSDDGEPTVYDERELSDFAWRYPNHHLFATRMDDMSLPNWRRAEPRPRAPGS